METTSTASFDTWTSLFLIVSSMGFFLTALLWSLKEERKRNFPIILILFGFSLILIQYVFIWTGYRQQFPYYYVFDGVWNLMFGPLIFWYILQYFEANRRLKYYHFIPAMIAFGFSLAYYFPTEGFTQFSHIKNDPFYALMWRFKSPWVGMMSMLVYLLFAKDFVRQSTNNEEITQENQLRNRWVQFILNFFTVYLLSLLSYYVLVVFPFFNSTWDYLISIVMSIGIYGVGIMVFKEKEIFNGELLSKIFLPKMEEKEDLNEPLKADLYQKLLTLMEREKPFLDNEIRLVHLADKIGYSTHLLSQIINEKAGQNFNQFINEYRLAAAENLLTKENNRPIKSICYEVGFNNKTTFFNAFRKKHGCTPAQFRRQIALN